MRTALLALLVASLTALDQSDPFWSGWRKAADFPAVAGLYAHGQQGIAWSPQSYRLSRDSGLTWSDPLMPPLGATIGATMVAPIAQAIVAGPVTWLRLSDGKTTDLSGQSVNAFIGGAAISRIAADRSGTLFAERGDGLRTVAVVGGAVAAEAAGRMMAVTADGVVVRGAKWWHLRASGAAEIRGPSGDEPGQLPLQTGVILGSWRDAAGSGWAVKDGAIRNTGILQGVSVLSLGLLRDEELALLRLADGRSDVTTARPGALLRGGDWAEGMPHGITAIAGSVDPDWADTRKRLVAVADGAIWIWRSR